MAGVIERRQWRLYDMDGSRMPPRSAGCGARMVKKSYMDTRERLLRARPYKQQTAQGDLMIAKKPKPMAAVDVSLRRCIINANRQEQAQ